MKIPSIKIQYDLSKEVDKFSIFLHHPFFPQHRNMIFRAFPELKDMLQSKSAKQEKIILKKFITDFRIKNNKKIKKIVKDSGRLLDEKSKTVLSELTKLMDYRWPKKQPDYTVIPTILPFSPFGKNGFFFSILGFVRGRKQNNLLFVTIHEISHSIFFEIIKKLYKNNFPLDKVSTHFLKEILAPVIMNQNDINKELNLVDYLGNPFLCKIFLSYESKNYQIANFFQNIYQAGRQKNMKFTEILEIMVSIMKPIQSEIKEKNDIWNQYGNNLSKNKSALKIYQKPINIKAPKLKELSALIKD